MLIFYYPITENAAPITVRAVNEDAGRFAGDSNPVQIKKGY
jgi:hypothetical protein